MGRKIPSYRQGFARNASESRHPNLWRGLIYAGFPVLGVTGDTLFDISPYKVNGALNNMPLSSAWVNSQYGSVLHFGGTGSTDYVELPDQPMWDDISTRGSIVTLFKTDFIPVGSIFPYAVSRRDLSTFIWALLLEGNLGGVLQFATAGTLPSLSGNTPMVGVWQDAAVTWSPSAGILYQDGGVVDSNGGGTLGTGSIGLAIGNRIGGGRDWGGEIATTLIFDRVLPHNEIILLRKELMPLIQLKTGYPIGLSIGAIMNQFQGNNLGADLYNGALM